MPLASRTRWAVPAAVAAVLAGAVAAGSATATADPSDLSPRTAAELLTELAGTEADAFTGTVTQTADLGLPELPAAAGGTLGPLTLATGTNTLQVAADGPDRSRVALLGQAAEYDVVRNGTDVWTWSSQTSQAVHLVLPTGEQAPVDPAAVPMTPAQAATAVLARLDPSTEVGVDDAVAVAGRPARQLVLTPTDATTLVGSVRVAVDAETSAPLRVQVFPRSAPAAPALDVGFTDVSFTAPDPGRFTFTPPAGADVVEGTLPARTGERPTTPGDRPTTTTVGTGWGAVSVVDGIAPAALTQGSPQLLDQVTSPVEGGRVLTTTLVSALLTDDGRLLVGAVAPETLQAIARG